MSKTTTIWLIDKFSLQFGKRIGEINETEVVETERQFVTVGRGVSRIYKTDNIHGVIIWHRSKTDAEHALAEILIKIGNKLRADIDAINGQIAVMDARIVELMEGEPKPKPKRDPGSQPCVNCGESAARCGLRENGDCCGRCNHQAANHGGE